MVLSKTAVCSVNMQPVVTNLIESVNSFQLHVTRHESRAHPESGTHFLIEFFSLDYLSLIEMSGGFIEAAKIM